MLLKLIVCRVPPEKRSAFSRAQEAWSALTGAEGFLGQAGGWDAAESNAAVILGLWRDEAAYRAFMAGLHDRVFDASGQGATYESCSVALRSELFPIPGESGGGAAKGLPRGAFLRVAECRILPGREDHFIHAQQVVWNPGMAGADGMLGGSFGRCVAEPRDFLVATFWASEEDHRRYGEKLLPKLRERSGAAEDLENLQGWRVALEPAWRVGASR